MILFYSKHLSGIPLNSQQIPKITLILLNTQVGRYEYKYVVDGVWMTNSESPMSHPNREGQVNNVLEVMSYTNPFLFGLNVYFRAGCRSWSYLDS